MQLTALAYQLIKIGHCTCDYLLAIELWQHCWRLVTASQTILLTSVVSYFSLLLFVRLCWLTSVTPSVQLRYVVWRVSRKLRAVESVLHCNFAFALEFINHLLTRGLKSLQCCQSLTSVEECPLTVEATARWRIDVELNTDGKPWYFGYVVTSYVISVTFNYWKRLLAILQQLQVVLLFNEEKNQNTRRDLGLHYLMMT